MADPELSADCAKSDPAFEPSERLFRRIPLAEVRSGTISDLSLPSPAFSVDRERYRPNPEDMLVGHPEFGVAAFPVWSAQQTIVAESGDRYDFGVEHRPITDNYAHSEVHSYREGQNLAEVGKKPPNLVRKKFRNELRKRIEILDLEDKRGQS